MTAKRWLFVLTAVLLLGVAVACTRARSDAQIVGEAVTKINSDPQVANKQIAVSSNNGVVTLNGTASSEAERAAVANDVAQVEGVRTVVNNLLLPAAPVAAEVQPAAQEEPAPVVETRAPEPAPARRKPSAYSERRRVSPPASDLPIISSGPASSTPVYSSPAPVITPAANVTPTVPPPPRPVTIEAGTTLSVRMVDAIDSGRNHPGDIFHATLDAPITMDDKVIIPEGADLTGRVANLKSAGKFEGQPELALELTSLSVNGRKYSLVTNQYTQQGKSRGARTAKTVGSGAAIGAIIGAIAGGGKGAAIGAAAGAGVGGGVQAAGHPEQVHIGTEALLNFRLESPLTVTPVGAVERHHMQNNWTAPTESNLSPPPSVPDARDNNVDEPPPSDSNRPVLKRRPGSN